MEAAWSIGRRPTTQRSTRRRDIGERVRQAFVPDPLADLDLALAGDTAGIVQEAESAIASLNAGARPLMAPLARLLLRSESIAWSKIEGIGQRSAIR